MITTPNNKEVPPSSNDEHGIGCACLMCSAYIPLSSCPGLPPGGGSTIRPWPPPRRTQLARSGAVRRRKLNALPPLVLPPLASPPVASPFVSPPLPQLESLQASMKHSIYTPIDDSTFMVAAHWEGGSTIIGWETDIGHTNRASTSGASNGVKRKFQSLEAGTTKDDKTEDKRLKLDAGEQDHRYVVDMVLVYWTLPLEQLK